MLCGDEQLSRKHDGQGLARPLWLRAQLTYARPLQRPHCSNPTELASIGRELDTAGWLRVLREARAMGATQLGLSGGEPPARRDLEGIVAEGRALGYYTRFFTSGMNTYEARLSRLKVAGLDHIQVGFQAASAKLNNFFGGSDTFEKKKAVAREIKAQGYPMVLNSVLHRKNIDAIAEILSMAEALGADHVEWANGRMGEYPVLRLGTGKPGGAFRGFDCMQEPCRSCSERFDDYGGCRCQAYMLTGDARAADPVCDKSPYHHLVTEAVARANANDLGPNASQPLIFRNPRNSRRLHGGGRQPD